MTMFDGRLRLSNQIVEDVKKFFGEKVYSTIINRNVRLSEAPSYGKPVLLYEAVSSGARNYMELAREFLGRQKASTPGSATSAPPDSPVQPATPDPKEVTRVET